MDDAGDDRGRRRARRDGQGADAARLPAAANVGAAHVATYLFTWNPRVYAWRDLRADVRRLRSRGILHTDWSCARSKRIHKGDRFFLLRQGVEPRGIVASGWTTSDWYEGPGWRRAGVPCNYVDIAFDALLDPASDPILPREALSHGKLGEMYWDTQVSGISIPDPIARELERAWRSFSKRRRS